MSRRAMIALVALLIFMALGTVTVSEAFMTPSGARDDVVLEATYLGKVSDPLDASGMIHSGTFYVIYVKIINHTHGDRYVGLDEFRSGAANRPEDWTDGMVNSCAKESTVEPGNEIVCRLIFKAPTVRADTNWEIHVTTYYAQIDYFDRGKEAQGLALLWGR